MIANTNNLVIPSKHILKPAIGTNGHAIIHASNFGETACIRSYQPTDRDSVCQLCCDTGFLGQPVDLLFRDRDLFAELFTKPYLDYEPECGFVAEAEGRVVGYLLGSVRRHFEWLQMFAGFQTATKMIGRLAMGHYANHPRSKKFIRWLFTSGLSEQPKHPAGAAHLHFNIDQRHRGRGIAARLWKAYQERLREVGVSKCYGAFFSCPKRRPEAAYGRYGFTVYDRRRTTLFEPEISDPVEVVCVCKDV